MADTSDSYRLPLDVRPTHYDVTIRTDLEKLAFDGFIRIDLDIKKETSQVVFHSLELNLGSAVLYSDVLQTEQPDTSRTYDKVQQRTTLNFAKPVPAGSKAQLRITFDGTLTGSMMGYYRSSYEINGVQKYYALTQFQPTAARRAFPCWDEPLLKATFALTLISREDTVNLANMPAISEKPYESTSGDSAGLIAGISKWLSSLTLNNQSSNDKWKITKFETTPLISTYLVAYANGHFKHLESSYTSPLSGKTRPLRIYATADNIGQAQFALDVKAKVVPLYEQIFDVEYPLPKLDTLIAADFDLGAMENWGLITGRTSVYCLDPERPTIEAKKRVATTQSHEVAHQWFGNITTMAWWDNLYLNEGFATLMGEVVITDKIFPEWRANSEFITDHLNRALGLDAKLSSHPIEVECPDANQINQIFDSLSYSKAASVLRMLSEYVGEERFLNGVSIYLKKHLYANSVSHDLWEGVSESAGKDVTKMMDTWVGKIGFPVLTVSEVDGGIKVRQDRYLETGPAEPKDNDTIWTVPLSLLTVQEEGKTTIDKSIILDEREKFYALDTNKAYKLNAGTTGVYRVAYTSERLAKIADELAKEKSAFSMEDRIGTVYDVWALAKSGHTPASSALNLVNTLHEEPEYLVWNAILGNLSRLRSTWFENEKIVNQIDALRRTLLEPIVKKLGYEYPEDDSVDTVQLRTLAIEHAAGAGVKSVVEELRRRFSEYQNTGNESVIPANLITAIYTTAIRTGGRDEYNAIMKIQENPKNPAQRLACIRALGATPDPKVAVETLDYAMKNARDQDFSAYFGTIGGNIKTRRVAGDYFKEHYDSIYKRFENNFSLAHYIAACFANLSSEKDYDEVSAFFKDKDINKYKLSLHQSLDSIKANAAWIKRATPDIEQWLDSWEKR